MEFPKPTNRQTAKEKQRSRYETLIFTRLVLLVAVPLLIVGLLCGILYYRSEFARGCAKLGEVAGNASMRMTSVFDGPIWIPMWSGTNTSISATAGC
mgnify:CR=1 FL=1